MVFKKQLNQNFRYVLVRVPMHFSVKFFLTAKLHIVLVFEEQDAILNFGLAPFFKTILFIEMKKSPYFQTILDENLNKRLQRGQIDILISFRMKMIKKLIPDTSILNFLMEPLQPISEKPSCQESKSLTKITFYKSCQMDQM